MTDVETKCGVVVLAGAPNAGKSTLLNYLVGEKISIVSPKAQTTRSRVSGIVIEDETQIVFNDIPGIFKLQGKLNNSLNKKIVDLARNSLEGADYICFLKDVTKRLNDDERYTLNLLSKVNIPKILILNKIDKISKPKLIEISARLNDMMEFEQTFMVSALRGDGLPDLVNFFVDSLPNSPWLYPEDQISDTPMRLLAAEITREKLFLNLQKELPYSTFVETETYEENHKSIKINQSIYTVSDGHKAIILGKGGEQIKKIGSASRFELEKITGKKVSLFLFVKVRDNWMDNKESYRIQNIE